MKMVKQALVLISVFAFAYLWKINFSSYNIQLLSGLIILYLLLSFKNRGKGLLTMGGNYLATGILTLVILTLIFSTGGINSLVFFLLFFLAFGIAFTFDPLNVFVLILLVIILFYKDISLSQIENLVKIGGLALLSPIAFFFGKEYQKDDKQETKIEAMEEREREAADTIAKDIDQVIKNEKQNLAEKDLERLNEILEETEDLRKESKNKI